MRHRISHAAGDEMLEQIGQRLTAAGRGYDNIARIGGDEFAVVMEDIDADSAELAARRLLSLVSEVTPAGSTQACSVSIGVALTGPDCTTSEQLLRRADIAMYTVKASGRAGVAVYERWMGRSRLDQNTMTRALKTALLRDQLTVLYQPILDLRTHAISGAEALVRWQHPERGLLSPESFVPSAEDSGMIVPIGRRVLDTACRALGEWRRTVPGAENLTLSINVSNRQLRHHTIRDDIVAALDAAGIPPSALTLEVNEAIFVEDGEAAGEHLRSLDSIGVRLALDDFGTGFSSLSFIHRYPFDTLKIDRAFVKSLGDNGSGSAVVKTMLGLGRQLAMTTVAEGIEDTAELAMLRSSGCSHGQGFLFSEPVDLDRFDRLLASQPLVVTKEAS